MHLFGLTLTFDIIFIVGALVAGAIFCPPSWRTWARSLIGLSA